jgi:hypothetical protein
MNRTVLVTSVIGTLIWTYVLVRLLTRKSKTTRELKTASGGVIDTCPFWDGTYGPVSTPTEADKQPIATLINAVLGQQIKPAFALLAPSYDSYSGANISGSSALYSYKVKSIDGLIHTLQFADDHAGFSSMILQIQSFPFNPNVPTAPGSTQTVYAKIPIAINPTAIADVDIKPIGYNNPDCAIKITICATLYVTLQVRCPNVSTTEIAACKIDYLFFHTISIYFTDSLIRQAVMYADLFTDVEGMISTAIRNQVNSMLAPANQFLLSKMPLTLPLPVALCALIPGDTKTGSNGVVYTGLHGYRINKFPDIQNTTDYAKCAISCRGTQQCQDDCIDWVEGTRDSLDTCVNIHANAKHNQWMYVTTYMTNHGYRPPQTCYTLDIEDPKLNAQSGLVPDASASYSYWEAVDRMLNISPTNTVRVSVGAQDRTANFSDPSAYIVSGIGKELYNEAAAQCVLRNLQIPNSCPSVSCIAQDDAARCVIGPPFVNDSQLVANTQAFSLSPM